MLFKGGKLRLLGVSVDSQRCLWDPSDLGRYSALLLKLSPGSQGPGGSLNGS